MLRKAMSTTKKRYAIIGAGMSGASAASELHKQGIPLSEIIILEKSNRVGGMMRTISNGIDTGAKVLMANYPAVNALHENQLTTVNFLPVDTNTVNHILYGTTQPSLQQQFNYGMRLCYESVWFAKEVWSYHNACQNLDLTPPPYQDASFAQFAEQKQFDAIAKFLKLWVPLMGYGSLDNIPAYRVLSYMSYDSVPGLSVFNTACSPFYVSVKGGYQQIVENMLEGFDLRTSVNINSIQRDDQKAVITFTDDNHSDEIFSIEAENLILAVPPKNWPELNMKLTDTELKCVEESSYYRYPVAICDIKNFPANQIIVPEALEESGFGHIALVCAQEEINHGWRCSIYMNVKPGDNDFSLEIDSPGREILLDDLEKLGFSRDTVSILDTKIWNYNTCIPWNIGMKLEREQGRMCTLHVNGAKPNSFETVKRTEESARETIQRHLANQTNQDSKVIHALYDGLQYFKTVGTFFFKLPREEARIAAKDSDEMRHEQQLRS